MGKGAKEKYITNLKTVSSELYKWSTASKMNTMAVSMFCNGKPKICVEWKSNRRCTTAICIKDSMKISFSGVRGVADKRWVYLKRNKQMDGNPD